MFKKLIPLILFAFTLALFADGLSTGAEKAKDKAKTKKNQAEYDDDTFVPTPDEVINKMFELAKIKKDDVIFDLGCGDGRILYMAAKKYGTRGVGLELNPLRIKEAMEMYEKFNEKKEIGTLVEIRHGDALKPKDLKDASVVVLYMFPKFMNIWFPIARDTLKPGTRIVSHDYSWEKDVIPEAWDPVTEVIVKSPMRDNHKVLLWVVPEKKRK